MLLLLVLLVRGPWLRHEDDDRNVATAGLVVIVVVFPTSRRQTPLLLLLKEMTERPALDQGLGVVSNALQHRFGILFVGSGLRGRWMFVAVVTAAGCGVVRLLRGRRRL